MNDHTKIIRYILQNLIQKYQKKIINFVNNILCLSWFLCMDQTNPSFSIFALKPMHRGNKYKKKFSFPLSSISMRRRKQKLLTFLVFLSFLVCVHVSERESIFSLFFCSWRVYERNHKTYFFLFPKTTHLIFSFFLFLYFSF